MNHKRPIGRLWWGGWRQVAVLLLVTLNASGAELLTLEIGVDGVVEGGGTVRLALFTPAERGLFPDRLPALKQSRAATAGRVVFQFPQLEAGEYVALVFQDENENGTLDRAWLGIPLERWGVTGKRPFGRPPRYEESRFPLNRHATTTTIQLE